MSDLPPATLPADPAALRLFGRLCTGIGIAAFLGMTFCTLLGVAARYLGLRGVDWSFEGAEVLFLWVCFFGAITAEIRRENVAFALLAERLKGPAARALALVSALLILWFTITLMLSGWAYGGRSGMSPTPVTRLPRWIEIGPMVVFAAGVSIIILMRTLRDLLPGRRA